MAQGPIRKFGHNITELGPIEAQAAGACQGSTLNQTGRPLPAVMSL